MFGDEMNLHHHAGKLSLVLMDLGSPCGHYSALKTDKHAGQTMYFVMAISSLVWPWHVIKYFRNI